MSLQQSKTSNRCDLRCRRRKVIRARIDCEIARYALGWAEIRRLMTIPGISVTRAATLIATIGRIDRFASARHLVGYIGLDPSSRQSGVSPVHHGHISKQGSSAARHVLCESRARRDARPRARCARSVPASARGAAARSQRLPLPASSSA
jgi:transposase